MPLPPLTSHDVRNLAGIMSAATDMMTAAWSAHACGLLGPDMRGAVQTLQVDMARFLAFFEDGSGYGLVDNASIATLRNLEQMASDLIEHTEDAFNSEAA